MQYKTFLCWKHHLKNYYFRIWRSPMSEQHWRLPRTSLPERRQVHRRDQHVHLRVPARVVRQVLLRGCGRMFRQQQPLPERCHMCQRRGWLLLHLCQWLRGRQLWKERGWLCFKVVGNALSCLFYFFQYLLHCIDFLSNYLENISVANVKTSVTHAAQ